MARLGTKSPSPDAEVLVAAADPPSTGAGGASGADLGTTGAGPGTGATPGTDPDDAAGGSGRRPRRGLGARLGRDDSSATGPRPAAQAGAPGAVQGTTKGAAKGAAQTAAQTTAPGSTRTGGRGAQTSPDTPARPAVPAPPLTPQELLRAWTYTVRVRAEAHGAAASRYLVAARGAASIASVLAAGVGGSLVTTATGTGQHPLLTPALAVASAVAAVLGVFLLAFDLPDRATRHRHAAVEHIALFRRLEQLESVSKGSPTQSDLEGFRSAWTTVEAVAPMVGRRRLARARRAVAKQDR